MNIEHESGENGGNGGSSCGFIALVAVVGFPSCGRKGRLMWDSPWIRSSRQNFSLLRRRWQCDSENFVSVNCQLPINLLSDCSKSPSKGPLSLLSEITADSKLHVRVASEDLPRKTPRAEENSTSCLKKAKWEFSLLSIVGGSSPVPSWSLWQWRTA